MSRRLLFPLLLAVSFFLPLSAEASISRPEEVPPFLWRLFSDAAIEYSLPVNTLTAISKFESSFNPYACNFAGKSKYFSTRSEALWAIEEFRRRDYGVLFGATTYYGDKDVILRRIDSHPDSKVRIVVGGKKFGPFEKKEAKRRIGKFKGSSFDVGLMQINSYWINKFKLSISDLLDPSFNIRFGAWVLRSSFDSYGLGAHGIGGYHTNPKRNPSRSLWYAEKVLSSHKRLFGF